MSHEKPHFYEFGPYRLDPRTPLLLREGRPVALTLKALETLAVLVERGGQVVSRKELIEAVWPDTFVEENNLSVSVSALRKALGGGAGDEQYIETVPRRGYRFAAAVRELAIESAEITHTRHTRSLTLVEETTETGAQAVAVATDSAPDVTPEAAPAQAVVARPAAFDSRLRRLARWPVLIAAVVAVAALAAGASFIRRGWQSESDSVSARRGAAAGGAGAMSVRSLAVLPFKHEAGAYNFGQYNGGEFTELTDAVVARLGATGQVNVALQEALLAEKATPNNMLLVGHRLNADAVLTGAVFRHDAEAVRLRLHLVSVNGGEVLWADTVGASQADVPTLLDIIAENVLAGLQRLRSAEEYERRATRHTANREAYQRYLQGRFLWEQRNDVFAPLYISLAEGHLAGINQLEQALALDPNFAPAYLGIADHYKVYGYHGSEWRLGEEYALKALALDPDLAEAHATHAFIRMFYYWDWAGAEAGFKRALELDPDCVTAHQWYALFHALRGNHFESIKEITRARELAPYSFSVAIDAAEMQYYWAGASEVGTFNDPIALLRRVLGQYSDSSVAQNYLARAYWMRGEEGDREKAVAIEAGDEWKGSPQDFARERAGPRKGSREFDDIQHPDTYNHARWSAILNRREEALDLLERAYRDHHFFIIYIKAEPFFKNLHDEPRFQELLSKLGLAG